MNELNKINEELLSLFIERETILNQIDTIKVFLPDNPENLETLKLLKFKELAATLNINTALNKRREIVLTERGIKECKSFFVR